MIILDSLDRKLLDLIGKQELHPSEISRRLGILRTTIQYRLKRSEKLGLTTKKFQGRKTIWSAVFKHNHNKNHFRIYQGDDLLSAYSQLLSLPTGTTILAIQGSQAAKDELSFLPQLFIKKSHKTFKRKRFILKGISNQEILEIFKNLEKPLIKSHIGRILGLKLTTDNRFLGSGEIMSTQKLILISNPAAQQAVVIKDKEITAIIYELISLMFELLENKRTFDLNDYLKIRC